MVSDVCLLGYEAMVHWPGERLRNGGQVKHARPNQWPVASQYVNMPVTIS